MATTIEARLSDEENVAVSQRVREELARRRITRQQLAVDAKISLSTLEKALSGKRPFTLTTAVRLEEALGLRLRTEVEAKPETAPTPTNGLAPEDRGSYAHPAVSWLEGDYLTLRPSFGLPGAMYAYRTNVAWDDDESCLMFREAERIDADFTQWGHVSIPHQSGHIYLVTNRHGQHRLIVAARPTITGELHGILTTLQAGLGSQLIPVSTPIALAPIANFKAPTFGRIESTDVNYATYRKLLDRTTKESYARFVTFPPDTPDADDI